MHFIDDVDPIGAPKRREFDVFAKLPDVVHPGIRGAVDLDDVNRVATRYFQATLALAAGFRGRPPSTLLRTPLRPVGSAQGFAPPAIQCLGQNPGGRGLAHPTHSGKEISMGNLLPEDGVPQRLYDVRLPDQLFKCARTKFSGGNLIFHHSSCVTRFIT